jgi:NADH:ubiquinone oxidoreductase subunit E
MKALTVSAAVVVLACIAALSVDYAVARARAPRNDQRILELQNEVHQSSAKSAELEAEQKRITSARDARNTRTRWLSWALMVAAVAFVAGAKRLVPGEVVVQALARPSAPNGGAQPLCKAQPCPTTPPQIDLSFVDQIVAREGRGLDAAIPILQGIQAHYRYLPDAAIQRVCELTEITPAQIAGTSSFYVSFRKKPTGEHLVRVCHGTACHVAGARQITDELRRSLGIAEGEDTDAARKYTIEEVACLGCCSLAPMLMVDDRTAGKLTLTTAREALEQS